MVAHKDFSCLIAAARRLDCEHPGHWRFLLLGDGPERPRLVAEAGELQARGVVEFIDPGLEVLPLVARRDFGVLMSNEAQHREGCSNAIMEYMSLCPAGGLQRWRRQPRTRARRTDRLLRPGGRRHSPRRAPWPHLPSSPR